MYTTLTVVKRAEERGKMTTPHSRNIMRNGREIGHSSKNAWNKGKGRAVRGRMYMEVSSQSHPRRKEAQEARERMVQGEVRDKVAKGRRKAKRIGNEQKLKDCDKIKKQGEVQLGGDGRVRRRP